MSNIQVRRLKEVTLGSKDTKTIKVVINPHYAGLSGSEVTKMNLHLIGSHKNEAQNFKSLKLADFYHSEIEPPQQTSVVCFNHIILEPLASRVPDSITNLFGLINSQIRKTDLT